MAATMDLKSKEEKDAELNKRIEALRRKNEALIRRYQEIEEDRKKAELEGVAVTAPRKGRSVEKENLVVEVVNPALEWGLLRIGGGEDCEPGPGGPPLLCRACRWPRSRQLPSRGPGCPSLPDAVTVFVPSFLFQEKSLGPARRTPGTSRPPGASKWGRTPPQRGGQAGPGRVPRSWEDSPGEQPRGGAGARGRRGRGRGGSNLSGAGDASTTDRKSKEWEERRRQNIEKMNEEMEKIAEYERNQREGLLEPNPVRNFLDDPRRRGGPLEEPERDRREGSRRHGRNWGGPDFERVRCGLEHERQGRRAALGGAGDMTLSMTGRERSEYLRWKQEREKIDQERLQRHRKPTGQWRREWDAEKTDGMFKDGPTTALEPSHRYDDQAWARPPKPPTFGEFLSKHKAEVSSRRRRKSSQPQAKAAPRAYSDHDDRWETKEAVVVAPEPSQPSPPKEEHTQPPAAPAPAHRPPEDEGEEDDGEEDEGEEDEGDEEWEDMSDDEEDEMEEEEEGDEEEEPAKDQQPPEADPTRKPPSEQASGVPSRPEEPQAPALPSSPFSPPGGHQPVSDWGEEMELNSPRTAHPAGVLSPGGDQLAPASLESGPSLPGRRTEEEEGSEAAAEAGPEDQETAEITGFQRASPNS
ncbi:coiled-coil domain-containing protein 9 isoform X2 [Choloepus didactylus]|uniref:coiled-coil domain-containing protein 9 isoform X2 n=1 Tax=Choloepus didactylus TaxID=27675 RepID=UPI0018A0DFC0|nr:coiled-coil domain-containing protein 9 isoform X2 [Choloepus didactylus]